MSLLRAYVLDDEPLAVNRLTRLLQETGRVQVIGSSSDPQTALEELPALALDVLFIDIEMPVLSGFDVLARLQPQPFVVFTTAYHQYALQAFEVNSVDYLLKPIEAALLDRALRKLERLQGTATQPPDLAALLQRVTQALQPQTAPKPQYVERLASRIGEKVELVDVRRVTHFYAQDKLTYAATPAKPYCIDETLDELEKRLDPDRFLRIHRSTIVALSSVMELHPWLGGRLLLKLKDDAHTELTVARERAKVLKEKLGI